MDRKDTAWGSALEPTDILDISRKKKAGRDFVALNFSKNIMLQPDDSTSQKRTEELSVNKNSEVSVSIDVVIIVAVADEKKGVYSAFNLDPSVSASKKFDMLDEYRFDYIQFKENDLNIALLIQPSMGMTQAASMTTRVVLALHPKLVAMVGVCAGCQDSVHLGDIIIASDVYDYTAGKHYIDRFGPRPQGCSIDNAFAGYINGFVIDNQTLIGQILDGKPDAPTDHKVAIHFKPIASGTAIVNDPEIVDELKARQDNLAGIDMEAYALAVSCNILRTRWIVIKGVQDHADGDKEKVEKGYRGFAAYSSAKLLQLMLKEDLPRYF